VSASHGGMAKHSMKGAVACHDHHLGMATIECEHGTCHDIRDNKIGADIRRNPTHHPSSRLNAREVSILPQD